MSDIDRARALAQSEFQQHVADYERLKGIADLVMTAMEFHAAQMDRWQGYLADLAIDAHDNVIPLQRTLKVAETQPPVA